MLPQPSWSVRLPSNTLPDRRHRNTAGSCHFRTHAVQQNSSLFDYLVGAAEEGERDGEAERLGGLHVDD
jgi:hypothetical protein